MNLPIGVLLMAYGAPDSLEEMAGYLADIRAGRPTPPALLDEITANYRRIGGRSPLRAISERQLTALSARLNPSGHDPHFRCYLGMRHWRPWIEETVREMLEDGIGRAVSLVLAPHFSALSVAKYQEKIAAGLEMHRGQIDFTHVESYHTAPKYIAALANRVQAGLRRWPQADRHEVHVVFSAHSLPERILDSGDPYDSQLQETAGLVADHAGLAPERWSWSYQSAGRTDEKWLGPQLQEHLPALAARGIRNVVSVPVGFVSDNVEILYDIDVLAQTVAREHGLQLERPPALNDDPLFIDALAAVVRAQAAQWMVEDVR